MDERTEIYHFVVMIKRGSLSKYSTVIFAVPYKLFQLPFNACFSFSSYDFSIELHAFMWISWLFFAQTTEKMHCKFEKEAELCQDAIRTNTRVEHINR